jgi:hypothetical protein
MKRGTVNHKMEPLRKGKTWSDDEVLQLLQNVRKKKSHEEIASEH